MAIQCALMKHSSSEEPAEASGETDMADLEDAIGEIESVVDLEMVNQIAEEKELQEKVPAASGMTELVPEEAEEIVDVSAQETVSEEEEESRTKYRRCHGDLSRQRAGRRADELCRYSF